MVTSTLVFIQAELEAYTFLLFAGLLVFFFIFTFLKIPETKGKQTKDIMAQIIGDN